NGIVYSVAFSPDGAKLVAGGAFTGEVKVYDLRPVPARDGAGRTTLLPRGFSDWNAMCCVRKRGSCSGADATGAARRPPSRGFTRDGQGPVRGRRAVRRRPR